MELIAHVPPEKRRRLDVVVGQDVCEKGQQMVMEVVPSKGAAEEWESTSAIDHELLAGATKSSSMSADVSCHSSEQSPAAFDGEGYNLEEALAEIVENDASLEAEVIADLNEAVSFSNSAMSEVPPSSGLPRRLLEAAAVWEAGDDSFFEEHLVACWRARESRAPLRKASEVTLRAQVLAFCFVHAAPADAEDETTPDRLSEMVAAVDHVALDASGALEMFLGTGTAGGVTAEVGNTGNINIAPSVLPLDFLQHLVSGVEDKLPKCEAFCENFPGLEAATAAARGLSDPILQVAGRFIADGAMSEVIVLSTEPNVAAAAAVALATGVVLRRMGMQVGADELLSFLEAEGRDIELLRASVADFSDVFDTWRSLRQRQASGNRSPRAAARAAPKLAGGRLSP